MQVRRSVQIDAPPRAVWPVIAELEHELQWRSPWVLELEQLDDGELGPGTRIGGTTKVLGMTDSYVNEVTEYSPPRRYAWRGVEASGGIMGTGSYELEPLAGDRTRMTLSMDYRAEGLAARIQLPVVGLVGKRLIGRMLDQLAAYAEEHAAAEDQPG